MADAEFEYRLKGFRLAAPRIFLKSGDFDMDQLCVAVMEMGGFELAQPVTEIAGMDDCVEVVLSSLGDDVRAQARRITNQLGVRIRSISTLDCNIWDQEKMRYYTGVPVLDHYQIYNEIKAQGECIINVCMRNISEDPSDCYIRLPFVGDEHRYGSRVFNATGFFFGYHFVYLPPGESFRGTITFYPTERRREMLDRLTVDEASPVLILETPQSGRSV